VPESRRTDVLVLLAIAVALRGLGLRRVDRLLRRMPQRRRAEATPPTALARRVERAAARSPVPVRCLARSVCLQWLLRRRGIDSRLRIGTAREHGVFRAHAWVELEGRVLGDDPEHVERYAAFDHEFDGRAGQAS